MNVSRDDLGWAASQGVITSEQANALWKALESRHLARARFEPVHILYYFGAFIVIGAMGWFMTLAWEQFGGGSLFVISAGYALLFVMMGRTLWKKQDLQIAGGLLFTMAVCMTPLAIYGLERLTGIWVQGDPGPYRDFHPLVKGSWFLMEVGTIIAGVVAISFVRFPFLTALIAFVLWYMSMDLTPLLFGKMEFSWDERLWVSVLFGLVMILVAYLIDRRTKEDYAFWCYLFGLLAFWDGLSLMESGSEINRLLYCLINLGLMLLSVLLERRAFLIFGVVGVFGYIGYLANRVFKDALVFPFVLSLLGILVIYLGVQYQRHRQFIETRILASVPDGLRSLLPRARMTS